MKSKIKYGNVLAAIVASFAEAWIEIVSGTSITLVSVSPPSRRRGLKLPIPYVNPDDFGVASFAEAWIEIG